MLLAKTSPAELVIMTARLLIQSRWRHLWALCNWRLVTVSLHKSKALWLLVVWQMVLCGNLWAGLRRGTEIVIFYSHERIIIAADSRATITGEKVKHRDGQCKVFELADKVLFAGAGLVGHDYQNKDDSDSWDAYEQARMVAAELASERNPATDIALETAKRWAERMKGIVEHELLVNFAAVTSNLPSSRAIESAVFAGLTADKQMSLYRVEIVWDRSEVWPRARIEIHQQTPAASSLPAGYLGRTEGLTVFEELTTLSSPRAKAAQRQWEIERSKLSAADQDAFVTERIAELVAKWAGTADIGGPIDVVELRSSGEIRWIQRQHHCADTL